MRRKALGSVIAVAVAWGALLVGWDKLGFASAGPPLRPAASNRDLAGARAARRAELRVPRSARPPEGGTTNVDIRRNVGIDPKLGGALPLDAEFFNQDGARVRLGDLFGRKPVILTPVYYRCPMLCGIELQGLVRCLRGMEMTAGDEFEIVTFSIDPREGPELAREKRRALLKQYGRDEAESGWQCLVGDEEAVRSVCEAIGFRAQFNPESGQYAHAAAIAVCTPDGRVARYFYGVEFAPRDVRLGLVEASENRIGTLTDQALLYCYLYDPTRGKYGLAILRLVRGAGILTVAAIAGGIGWMLRRERRRARKETAHAV